MGREIVTVVGIHHKVGIYENKPYDNTVFHVMFDADVSKEQTGSMTKQFKVKTFSLSSLSYIPKIGDVVCPVYNSYGGIEDFVLYEIDNK